MKVLLLAALLVTSLPSFATDSSAAVTTAVPPRGPGHGDPGHGPGHGPRPMPPRPPRPLPPPRQHYQCVARDRFQRSYLGDGWNLNDARRDALRSCQSRSVVKGCRVTDCGRRR